jgi:hypothetical protein
MRGARIASWSYQRLPNPSVTCLCRAPLREGGWLGRQDSNLGMADPKSAALPLGDAPMVAGSPKV